MFINLDWLLLSKFERFCAERKIEIDTTIETALDDYIAITKQRERYGVETGHR